MTTDAAPTTARRSRRLWLFGLLLALVAASATAALTYWHATQPPEPPAVASEGIDPEIIQAIDEARAEVRKSPRSGPAWGRLGMIYFAHAYPAEAQTCLHWAARYDPKDARWPYLEALTTLSNPDHSLPLLERAVELAPVEAVPRLSLGEMLLLLGRPDEAEAQFRRVLETNPDDARAHSGLGRAEYQRNHLDQAKEHLERAEARVVKVRALHALLAEIHRRQGNADATEREERLLADAQDTYEWPDPYVDEAERLRAGVGARVLLAERYFREGRRGESLAILDELVRSHPDSFQAQSARGAFLMWLGNLPAAEADLRAALRVRPDSVEMQANLGLVLENENKPADAAIWFRKAIDSKPLHAPAHYHLARCLLMQGDQPGAVQSFRDAARCKPDFAEAHRDLGHLLADTGNKAEARSELEMAVNLAPADALSRKWLEELKAGDSGGPKP
jgi:tetratricopeptide (TPR) repeat protein